MPEAPRGVPEGKETDPEAPRSFPSSRQTPGSTPGVWAEHAPQGPEDILPSGQQLMCIYLMPHVKKDLIFRALKCAMQRDGQLHIAQIARQMTALTGNCINNRLSDFLSEHIALGIRQLFDILWPMNRGKHAHFTAPPCVSSFSFAF